MPDTKVSALTDGVTADSTDRIPVARDAGGGTFNNRYVTPGYIGTTLLGSGTALTGATVNTSQPVLNLSQTWNDGAGGTVTFTGLKFNATDTASASGSLLLDLQSGAASRFKVDKYGRTTLSSGTGGTNTGTVFTISGKDVLNSAGDGAGAAWVLGYNASSNNNIQHWFGPANGVGSTSYKFLRIVSVNANTVIDMIPGDGAGNPLPVAFAGGIAFANNSQTSEVFVTRGSGATVSAPVLQLGAADTIGTTAPTPQKLRVQSWSSSTNNNQLGADFTIQGSQGTGTGVGGSIIFQVAPAGGSSNGVQNAYSTALTIASDKSATFAGGVTVSGVLSTFTANLNGVIFVGNNATLWSTSYLGFSSSGAPNDSNADTRLYRDTTSTLALRNGNSTGAAQRFNVYNTYTSSTNYETFKIDWITTANTCLIGTEKGSGGGNARALALQTDGTTRLTIETNGDLTIADAENIIVGSTTGTKIGTATSQKIGFWNATPIVQPTTGVAAATVAATGVGDVVAASTTFDGYTIPQIVKAMRNAGLLA